MKLSDKSERFTIKIFPSSEDSTEAEVLFSSKDVKNDYVSNEFKYCAKEYGDYCSAMSIDERATKFQILSIKRAQYARKSGYNPSKGYKNVWTFSPEPPKPGEHA